MTVGGLIFFPTCEQPAALSWMLAGDMRPPAQRQRLSLLTAWQAGPASLVSLVAVCPPTPRVMPGGLDAVCRTFTSQLWTPTSGTLIFLNGLQANLLGFCPGGRRYLYNTDAKRPAAVLEGDDLSGLLAIETPLKR